MEGDRSNAYADRYYAHPKYERRPPRRFGLRLGHIRRSMGAFAFLAPAGAEGDSASSPSGARVAGPRVISDDLMLSTTMVP